MSSRRDSRGNPNGEDIQTAGRIVSSPLPKPILLSHVCSCMNGMEWKGKEWNGNRSAPQRTAPYRAAPRHAEARELRLPSRSPFVRARAAESAAGLEEVLQACCRALRRRAARTGRRAPGQAKRQPSFWFVQKDVNLSETKCGVRQKQNAVFVNDVLVIPSKWMQRLWRPRPASRLDPAPSAVSDEQGVRPRFCCLYYCYQYQYCCCRCCC